MRLQSLVTKIVPLAFLLAACSPQQAGQSQMIASASAQSLPGSSCGPSGVCDVQTASLDVVSAFPTSFHAAEGTPWHTMHENGNRASPEANYVALGYSPQERRKIQQLRDQGKCVAMELPNGVVADAMSFTDPKTGKLVVQYNVLVDLKGHIPTRTTLVCEVAQNDYLVHALGCNNYLRIKGRARPAPQRVAVVPQTFAAKPCCEKFLELRPMLFEAATLQCNSRDSRDVVPELKAQLARGAVSLYHSKNPIQMTVRNLNANPGSDIPAVLHGIPMTLKVAADRSVTYPVIENSGRSGLAIPHAVVGRDTVMSGPSSEVYFYPDVDCKEPMHTIPGELAAAVGKGHSFMTFAYSKRNPRPR